MQKSRGMGEGVGHRWKNRSLGINMKWGRCQVENDKARLKERGADSIGNGEPLRDFNSGSDIIFTL